MSENMEKKTNNIRFAVGFLAFGLLWSTGLYVVATVLRIQKVSSRCECLSPFQGADFDSASCSAAISSVRVYYSGPSRRRLWNARMAKRET